MPVDVIVYQSHLDSDNQVNKSYVAILSFKTTKFEHKYSILLLLQTTYAALNTTRFQDSPRHRRPQFEKSYCECRV